MDIGGSTGIVSHYLAKSFNLDATVLDPAPLEIQEAKKLVLEQKEVITKLELERQALNQHSITLKTAETEIFSFENNKKQSQLELTQVVLGELPKLEISPEEIAKSLQTKNKDLQTVDTELQNHIAFHAKVNAEKNLSESAVNKIISLDQCPTCGYKDLVKKGFRYTQARKNQRYKCNDCKSGCTGESIPLDNNVKP